MREALSEVLEAHSAGSPTDPLVRWTDLKPMQVARELVVLGVTVSRNTAAKLLVQAGFRRRSRRKELITGPVDPQERDQQFRHIAALRRLARARGIAVLCIDTKKKEHDQGQPTHAMAAYISERSAAATPARCWL